MPGAILYFGVLLSRRILAVPRRFLSTCAVRGRKTYPRTLPHSAHHAMAGYGPSDGEEYTRLHITPLTPTLIPTLLPPSLLARARNISYHTLQTFPERAYGFLELPAMEASKLQKKLNGSILKGSKIRIETARPQKLPVSDEPEPESSKKERSKKRKRDETIPAIEIRERSVKRGWTVPSSQVEKKGGKKEKMAKSKYTSGKECLFKTVVPPNKIDLKEKKGKKRNSREEVVHEFEKTLKHASFLRGSNVDGTTKTVGQFVDGTGWVDVAGNLIEEVIKEAKSQNTTTTAERGVAPEEQSSEDDSCEDDGTLESESAGPQELSKSVDDNAVYLSENRNSQSNTSEARSKPAKAKGDPHSIPSPEDGSPTSSSGTSFVEGSESSSDYSDSEPEPANVPSSQHPETPSESFGTRSRKSNSRPNSSSGLTITIPQHITHATTSDANYVHPLEALYKRPAFTASSQTQPAGSRPSVPAFSFFGNDKDTEQEGAEPHDQMPFTPFTQREFEFRGQRSAAPTPDTAHPNKRFVWPAEQESDEEDDEDEETGSPSRTEKGKGATVGDKDGGGDGKDAESDFQKWFYEHRGETNRAWKRRRRVVAKEKRQRENRKSGDRAL